ncbi:MAG: T9SS type A sorting domain-containing protein [Bacteroidales bacterium]|nr:T9SS type A sorting domain-containing protein [Bacteroidales bacterium]MBN2748528.1 T9SS type A sorting domain-containing protein [Bacteroidales bacterium]
MMILHSKRVWLLLLLLFSIAAMAQPPVGSWRDHFSYNTGIDVAFGNGNVYCASHNGISIYRTATNEVSTFSKVQGLSGVGISSIAYSESLSILAVGYADGTIDLVQNDGVTTIVDIRNKLLQGSKEITDFLFIDDRLLIATGFGVVEYNLKRREVRDTYFVGNGGAQVPVFGLAFWNSRIYASTSTGLLSADANDPLLIHYNRWVNEPLLLSTGATLGDIATYSNGVVVLENTLDGNPDLLHYFNGTSWDVMQTRYGNVLSVVWGYGKVVVTSREGIDTYSSLPGVVSETISTYNFWAFRPNVAIPISTTEFAVADNSLGMAVGTLGSFKQILPNGPSSNRVYSIAASSARVTVAAGSRNAAWGNMYYPLTIYSFTNERWRSIERYSAFDAVRAVANPRNPEEVYVASWGNGIFRFEGGEFKEQFDQSNSSLQSIFPDGAFCRISGLAFDPKGNLWASNVMVGEPLSVKTTGSEWYSFSYASVINADRLSDLVCSPTGVLWLIIPRGEGLFALNPGGDVTLATDDKYRRLKLYTREGNVLPNDIYSIAFDGDGYLWVGTSEGVLVSYNPDKVFEANQFYAQRIKVPDVVPGLAVYLLESETINSIAIDGGNRKWLGTAKSGAYLQSADGSKQVLHFTIDNSPLPSNNILDIKVHPTTGEVFFATDEGMVSYRAESTLPNQAFGKVYAFPNPVRPNFMGVITIAGLMENTTVKIIDIAGNLVYETKSVGGQATWDGKNLRGRRVATGVYLILCSDSSGEQTATAKVLFVN